MAAAMVAPDNFETYQLLQKSTLRLHRPLPRFLPHPARFPHLRWYKRRRHRIRGLHSPLPLPHA